MSTIDKNLLQVYQSVYFVKSLFTHPWVRSKLMNFQSVITEFLEIKVFPGLHLHTINEEWKYNYLTQATLIKGDIVTGDYQYQQWLLLSQTILFGKFIVKSEDNVINTINLLPVGFYTRVSLWSFPWVNDSKSSRGSWTLLSIPPHLNNAPFWMVSIILLISKTFIFFPSSSEPFEVHQQQQVLPLLSYSTRYMYFSNWKLSLIFSLWSAGMAKSTRW